MCPRNIFTDFIFLFCKLYEYVFVPVNAVFSEAGRELLSYVARVRDGCEAPRNQTLALCEIERALNHRASLQSTHPAKAFLSGKGHLATGKCLPSKCLTRRTMPRNRSNGREMVLMQGFIVFKLHHSFYFLNTNAEPKRQTKDVQEITTSPDSVPKETNPASKL